MHNMRRIIAGALIVAGLVVAPASLWASGEMERPESDGDIMLWFPVRNYIGGYAPDGMESEDVVARVNFEIRSSGTSGEVEFDLNPERRADDANASTNGTLRVFHTVVRSAVSPGDEVDVESIEFLTEDGRNLGERRINESFPIDSGGKVITLPFELVWDATVSGDSFRHSVELRRFTLSQQREVAADKLPYHSEGRTWTFMENPAGDRFPSSLRVSVSNTDVGDQTYSLTVRTEYENMDGYTLRLTEPGWKIAVAYETESGWQNRRFNLSTSGQSIELDNLTNETVYWLFYRQRGTSIRLNHGEWDGLSTLSDSALRAIVEDGASPRTYIPGFEISRVNKVDEGVSFR